MTRHLDQMTLLHYLWGELDAPQASQIESHLAACAHCHGRVRELMVPHRRLEVFGEVLYEMRVDNGGPTLGEPFQLSAGAAIPFPRPSGFTAEQLGMTLVSAEREGRALRDKILGSKEPDFGYTLDMLDLRDLANRFGLRSALAEASGEVDSDIGRYQTLATAILDRLGREHCPSRGSAIDDQSGLAEYACPLTELRAAAYLLDGIICICTGNLSRAGDLLSKAWGDFAAGRASESSLALVQLFEAQRRAQNGDEKASSTLARQCYRTFAALGQDAHASHAAYIAGAAFSELGHDRESLEWYLRALRGFEKSTRWDDYLLALRGIGRCLLKSGKVRRVRREYENAAKRLPADGEWRARSRCNLAADLFEASHYKEASDELDRYADTLDASGRAAEATTVRLKSIECLVRSERRKEASGRLRRVLASSILVAPAYSVLLAEIERQLELESPDVSLIGQLRWSLEQQVPNGGGGAEGGRWPGVAGEIGRQGTAIRLVSTPHGAVKRRMSAATCEEESVMSRPADKSSGIDGHRPVIERALRRLDYLSAGVPLPEPYHLASGVAGKSSVYFFSLERHGSSVNLVIKIDEPERAAREWEVVRDLLKLNTPPSAMLPVHGNGEEDGVIIFKDAGAITTGVRTLQIGELLRQQITSNPGQCVDALDRAWEALDVFYRAEPGSVQRGGQGPPLTWDRAFPRVRNRLAEISDRASSGWPAVNAWLSSIGRVLPDPADRLGERAAALVGQVMLSRVHGDLNLQNILISVDGSARPVAALIIDLADSKPFVPTGIDFSRLESELWHEVFVGEKADAGDDRLLAAYLTVRDFLEGRQTNLPQSEAGTAEHYLRVVAAIRDHAVQLLRGNLPGYLLEDYLTALYFQHMQALSYPTVNQHPLKVRLALLGAAASLQFLEDLHSGRYAEKALNRLASPLRTYAEMTAPPSSVSPSPVQQPVSPQAVPKYSINIGNAKNVRIGDSDREKG